MKFLSKIAALLDTHSLFAWDAGTKQLIGCKWVMGTLDSATQGINMPVSWTKATPLKSIRGPRGITVGSFGTCGM